MQNNELLAGTPAVHPDDLAVDQFAAAMKAKLAKAREKGRGGWDDPEKCSVEYLAELLFGHVAKGDPVDIANFAMMLHLRGADPQVLRQCTVEVLEQAVNVRLNGNADEGQSRSWLLGCFGVLPG